MDRITLKEAFKAMEDLSDDIFDAFEQPEVKVINKKSLKESKSKTKKKLKESVEPIGEFNFDSNSDATCLLFNNYNEAYEYLSDLKEKQNLDANYEIVDENYFFPQDDTYGLMLRSDDETYEIVAYKGSNKNESLKEDYNYDLCDEIAEVLDNAGIMYGDIVANEDGTVNIVGVDEAEWVEAQEVISDELNYNVLIPDEDHDEFDDELIVTLDESCNECTQLEEQLPPDLAKAYRQAPVESDKIGFTGVGAKVKIYDNRNSPYLGQKDTRRNVKTDYANSEYKEITPEEALQAKKDGNIGKLRILVNGKLIQYRNDGYPLVGPELYGDKAYTKKNGEEVNDTRRMPFNYIVKIADKIYLTDEDEHSIGKGGREFDYETRQWKDVEGDSVYNRRQSNQDIEDTGEHKEKEDNWRRKSADNYKQDVKEYKDKLAKLEQNYANGDISKNAYEKTKAEYEREIERYTNWYKEYNAEANRDDQYDRNIKARKRYQVSQDKLQAPLIKLRDLKNEINYAKRELNSLEDNGLSSWRLQGGSYKEKQNEITKLKAQIEQAQKRIEQLEKESQGLDDANAKQNADAIEKAQNKVNDIQSQIDTLLRKNKNESLNLKESETNDYSYHNAQPVLNNVEELIAKGGSYNMRGKLEDGRTVYDTLSIFDWWPDKLTQNHLRQMKAFLKEAIKLGYTGYVCFKVGASGCSNGMWAYKEPTTTGYSPDSDAIYRSFTPDYTYYAVCVDGKWYPDEETNGEPYDSCKTTRQLEELISKFNIKKNESLKEATQIDINDPEDVEKGKKLLDDNKKEDEVEEMQVVDVDAETVDKLKDSYIGNVLLQCPICRTPIFKAPDKLVKDEENIAENPEDQLYNIGEQCPHCGNEKGFTLIGQVANMKVDAEEEDEETTGEEEVEKEDNFEQTTEDEISEEPIETETEEEEEDVTFESLDIDKFNSITNTYLTEVYSNVDSFTTTNATLDDENNKLVIEGIINYKSGKSKNTKFEFLGENITEDNKYIFKGLNETFAKGNDKAFTLKASINNNTLISESLDYDYTVTNTKLNESKIVKGSTLKEAVDKGLDYYILEYSEGLAKCNDKLILFDTEADALNYAKLNNLKEPIARFADEDDKENGIEQKDCK